MLHAAGPWTLGWDSVAVIVTAVLAAFTAWMAFETRRVAGRTEQEVEISRASLEAPLRPVLVDPSRPTRPEEIVGGLAQQQDEFGWPGAPERKRAPTTDAVVWETNDSVYLSVPLRNVGPGTALITGIGIRWERPLPGGGIATMAVVPPGERTRIQFTVPKEDQRPSLAEFDRYGTFSLEVAYSDVAGGQWTMTLAAVNLDRPYNRWHISQVHLHHKRRDRDDGSIDWGDPVASSGPAWGV